MSITVEATYHGGVLKPDSSVPLAENERVTITIEPVVRKTLTYGLIGWTGDPETVRHIAEDPELSDQESP